MFIKITNNMTYFKNKKGEKDREKEGQRKTTF